MRVVVVSDTFGVPVDPLDHPDLADALHRGQNSYADLVPRVEQLSQRELQVFALLGMGLSNRRISAVLAIGERTVKTFVGRVLTKLGLESRLQAGLAAAALADRGYGLLWLPAETDMRDPGHSRAPHASPEIVV
jgi:DNA-binding CsgD family transcriptional regulator